MLRAVTWRAMPARCSTILLKRPTDGHFFREVVFTAQGPACHLPNSDCKLNAPSASSDWYRSTDMEAACTLASEAHATSACIQMGSLERAEGQAADSRRRTGAVSNSLAPARRQRQRRAACRACAAKAGACQAFSLGSSQTGHARIGLQCRRSSVSVLYWSHRDPDGAWHHHQ